MLRLAADPARFSYALLLPPMRADLGWNHPTAGAMNTVNADGVPAARLAGNAAAHGRAGLGIIAAALLVPPQAARSPSAWAGAWLALGGLSALAILCTASGSRRLDAAPLAAAARSPPRLVAFGFGLAAHLMFGLGYIGYMTFIVTLLREQGLAASTVVAFYTLLGAGVVASSWLWAGTLQRHRGGVPLALFNVPLALATVLPVLGTAALVVFLSGALFGGVFLSVVAAITALVRHDAPREAWPAGIAAFTVVFAAGQIAGPLLLGVIADGPGALARGLAAGAAVLALGALLGSAQRPLPTRAASALPR